MQSFRGALGGEDERQLLFPDGVTYAGALVLFSALKPSAQQALLRELIHSNLSTVDADRLEPKEETTQELSQDNHPNDDHAFAPTTSFHEPLFEERDSPLIDEPKEPKTSVADSSRTEEEAVKEFLEDVLKRAESKTTQPQKEEALSLSEGTILSPANGDPSWTPLQMRLHKGVLEKYKNWRDGRDYAERMSDAWGVVTFLLEKRKGLDLNKKKSTHNSRVKTGKLQPGEDTVRWSSLTDVLYGLGLDKDAYTIIAEMFPLPSSEEPNPELLRGMTTFPLIRASRMGWGTSSLS